MTFNKKLGVPIFIVAGALCFSFYAFAGGGKMKAVTDDSDVSSFQLTPGSVASQLEEFINWMMKTKNLVVKPDDKPPTEYFLNSMSLTGSVDENRYHFRLSGGLVGDEMVSLRLFTQPHNVMLENVKINGKSALVGFDNEGVYYVKTKEKEFTVEGDMSLQSEQSLTIVGPLTVFTANLSSGRVIEGNKQSGVIDLTIHFEPGRVKQEEKVQDNRPPIYQISRAIRIQKEISFEYKVTVTSGSEISSVRLPLPFGENVLDVPGHNGWKIENGELLVPTSGKNIAFAVLGRLAKLGNYFPDERCSYEWWLIESDPEHRVIVGTQATQVDSSESPISRMLPSSRLFLVVKGTKLEVTVQELAGIEALAAVVSSHNRTAIWTKDGDLVSEDYFSYDNNGVDYLPYDAAGKPIYLEIDGQAEKILSDDKNKKNELLIPLKKGKHSVRVQSLSVSEPALFFGSIEVPNASYNLTASRASVRLGLSEKIIPMWFSGGEGVQSPISGNDLFFLALALIFALLFFTGYKQRAIGFIALAGIYFVSASVFIAIFALYVIVAIVTLIWRRLKGWRRWLAFAGAAFVLLLAIGLLSALRMGHLFGSAEYAMKEEASKDFREYPSALPSAPVEKKAGDESERYAQHRMRGGMGLTGVGGYEDNPAVQQAVEPIGNIFFSGLATVQGVTPVALPLPGYVRSVYVNRELVTKERPLKPKLIYVTNTAIQPLIFIWLLSLIYSLYILFPKFKGYAEAIRELWKTENPQT